MYKLYYSVLQIMVYVHTDGIKYFIPLRGLKTASTMLFVHSICYVFFFMANRIF